MLFHLKLAAVVLFAGILVTIVTCHVDGINGPGFFPWPWRAVPAAAVYPWLALASLPIFAAQWVTRQRGRAWPALVLLMAGCFAMKIASVAFRHDVTTESSPSLSLISIIVKDHDSTSYYTDALSLSNTPLRTWIALYPQIMAQLNLHTQTKPPGPVIYWFALIKWMGNASDAAMIGGLLLGAIATLSIPATYLFLRLALHGDEQAAFCGASYLAVSPGFVLFFPMFDPTYILLSTAIIGLWYAGLQHGRKRAGVMLGAVLALTCVITFNVLVIGLFMVALVFVVAPERPLRRRLRTATTQAILALATAVALLLILRAVIYYDPVATFTAAWHNQHELLRRHAEDRPYPQTIPWDLLDFALGSGWISILLTAFYFFSTETVPVRRRLAILAIAQLVVVALTGLLQTETARVWNFMLPLLMIPVGVELANWRPRDRVIVLAAVVLVTAAICQNIKFLY